jgi:predicted PhzF superfamily epimerase YddE/YHI9
VEQRAVPISHVLLDSVDSVLSLKPDGSRYAGAEPPDIGVVGPHPKGSDVAFEVRAFCDDGTGQLIEDPVTGSLNASLAQWLIGSGRAPSSYLTAQGTVLDRQGCIHITIDESGVWVGGSTTKVVTGQIG